MDFKEFTVDLCISSRGNIEEKLQWAFQQKDIDNDDYDGYITYEEMLQIVQSIYKMIGSMVELPEDKDTANNVKHITILTTVNFHSVL